MRPLSSELFSRLSLGLAAIIFLGVYPLLILFDQGALPDTMKPNRPPIDFTAYYCGGVVVKTGSWDSLYPIPKASVFSKPPAFTPVLKTSLFTPETGNPIYYPMVTCMTVSDCSPKLLKSFPQADEGFRYIYPPPLAILTGPLSLLSFDTAAYRVWPALCLSAYFFTALFSARIYRLMAGRPSYMEGFIFLACLVATFRGAIDVATGNVSPILSALIALSALLLIQRRLLGFSVSLILLVLFKSIGLNWLPLILLKREYWRTIIYLALLTVLLNAIVIYLGGYVAYSQFALLSPRILVPIGEGVVPSLLHLLGIYPRYLFYLINLLVLGALYYGYCQKSRNASLASPQREDVLLILAVLAGSMSLFCLTNFSIWRAYSFNYVLLPFLGWLLMEASLSTGKWKTFIWGGISFSFSVVSTFWIIQDLISTPFHVTPPMEAYTIFYKAVLLVLIPLFVMTVATRRLFLIPSETSTQATSS
jgi:hypothetical protein